jgi:hypothetical protein
LASPFGGVDRPFSSNVGALARLNNTTPMKRAQIIILSLLVVGLGLWIFKVEAPQMLREILGDRLVTLQTTDVRALTLSYPDGLILSAQREPDNSWTLTKPARFRADSDEIERLLTSIAGLTVERRLSGNETSSLAAYGLDGDGITARVSLELDGDQQVGDIVVGRTTPVGFSVFVRLADDDDIAIVPLIFNTSVKKSLFDLRDKHLFDFDPDRAVRITVNDPDYGRVVVARGDRDWSVIEPSIDDANSDAVRALLDRMLNAQAIAYFDGEEVSAEITGLDQPISSIQVDFDDNTQVDLQLGASDEITPAGVYIKSKARGKLAKIATDAKVHFDLAPSAFLDLRLARCDLAQVSRVFVARGGRTPFALTKKETGWKFEPYEGVEVDQLVATRFIEGLLKLRGENLVTAEADSMENLSRYGLDDPIVDLELVTQTGERCAALLAGAVISDNSDDVKYFLQRRGSPSVFMAEPHTFSRVDFFKTDFEAAPPPVPTDENPPEPAQQ